MKRELINSPHRCQRCKHKLTRPESIAAKIGPVCRAKGFTVDQTQEIQAEILRLAREILSLQKKGETYRSTKRKAISSFSLWKKNKSLVEGW